MSGIKIRFLGELEGSLSAQAITAALEARTVEEAEEADLVVTTPAALEEMLEDAAATAAYHSSRDQERVPIELVDRLLAGENPVKVWREHRGLSQRDLAARAGLNFAYLSQVETGSRNGSIQTVKKLAEALGVDLDDLI
ncbi:MAG TPA: helix-turn-helix transcriptional regulator [Stellaceae bacterium]|nr:helix-turn-helix transcriptional regulator [Stellaceae bacterium]